MLVIVGVSKEKVAQSHSVLLPKRVHRTDTTFGQAEPAYDKASFEVITLRGILYFRSQPVTRTNRPTTAHTVGVGLRLSKSGELCDTSLGSCRLSIFFELFD